MTNQVNYENKALLYAERYGIISYEVKGNTMIYKEFIGNDIYAAEVNLENMKETRKQIK